MIGGTPKTLPPEITLNESLSTESVDVYGFGMTVVAMQFGQEQLRSKANPGNGLLNSEKKSKSYAIAAKNLIETFVDSLQMNGNVDTKGFFDLIKSCIDEDPKKRPTFQEVIQNLENLSKNSIENTTEEKNFV